MILLGDVYIMTVGLNLLTLKHSEILALLQLFAIEITIKFIVK
jgi:energy-converting hydrogenase Eha subunit E